MISNQLCWRIPGLLAIYKTIHHLNSSRKRCTKSFPHIDIANLQKPFKTKPFFQVTEFLASPSGSPETWLVIVGFNDASSPPALLPAQKIWALARGRMTRSKACSAVLKLFELQETHLTHRHTNSSHTKSHVRRFTLKHPPPHPSVQVGENWFHELSHNILGLSSSERFLCFYLPSNFHIRNCLGKWVKQKHWKLPSTSTVDNGLVAHVSLSRSLLSFAVLLQCQWPCQRSAAKKEQPQEVLQYLNLGDLAEASNR